MRHFMLCMILGSAPLIACPAVFADELSFEEDVRPILKARCFHCHGEDDSLEGELDVRLRRLLMAGGDSGPALVPGNPQESLLFRRISSGEMPPDDKVLAREEIEVIRSWIEQGALTLRHEPASLEQAPLFTLEERNFWAFQPIARPPLPATELGPQLSPVDRFVQRRLELHGLQPAVAAERTTLVRRLYFDLLGVPPSPAEVSQFLADPAPNAFERLVDRLLASPQYGERWGRHWLDVAGYADSEGYVDEDPIREWAYSYRDYVIRAFNSDMPLDQFVVEQLAGDELVPPPYQELTPEQVRRLTATGFLRMAPDGTASGSVEQPIARNEVVSETINIVSTSLLGLTVGCAQCHNHRYDPITHEDYYRFRALFEPALDWKNWRTSQARRISLYTADDRAVAAGIESQAKQAEQERQQILDQHLARTLREELVKAPDDLKDPLSTAFNTPAAERSEDQVALLKQFPNIQNINSGSLYLYSEQRARRAGEIDAAADEKEQQLVEQVRANQLSRLGEAMREPLLQALGVPVEERTEEQQRLLTDHPGVAVSAATLHQFDAPGAELVAEYRTMARVCRDTDAKQQLADLQQGISDIRATIPKEHFIRALTEPPHHTPETVLFKRGNHTQPGPVIEPGELTILGQSFPAEIPLDDPTLPTTGRRLRYAEHLTSGKHPLLARVLANRFWLHHFGRGLVNTPGDFGQLGDRPTHPQLLDWLAADLMEHGWQAKRLHRQILTSHTWRQSSLRTSTLDEVDPDNQLLARQSMRRLESETLRDAILVTSGALTQRMFGPPIPVREDEVGQIVLGEEDLDGERKPRDGGGLGADEHRRSLYVQVRRSRPLAVLETFDLPTLSPNCPQRSFSNVAPQALLLMNSQFMAEYAERFAERVWHEAGEDPTDQVRWAWQLAYGQTPSESQQESLAQFLRLQTERFKTLDESLDDRAAHQKAMNVACQALLAANAFLYID